jgi:hypothetical protein
MALLFVRFDQGDEQVEGIRFGRALPRFVIARAALYSASVRMGRLIIEWSGSAMPQE